MSTVFERETSCDSFSGDSGLHTTPAKRVMSTLHRFRLLNANVLDHDRLAGTRDIHLMQTGIATLR